MEYSLGTNHRPLEPNRGALWPCTGCWPIKLALPRSPHSTQSSAFLARASIPGYQPPCCRRVGHTSQVNQQPSQLLQLLSKLPPHSLQATHLHPFSGRRKNSCFILIQAHSCHAGSRHASSYYLQTSPSSGSCSSQPSTLLSTHPDSPLCLPTNLYRTCSIYPHFLFES